MLGHLIYNYEHLDDLRIQEEISKNLYRKHFGGVYLAHAYNGKKSFGYRPYLEDVFLEKKNRGHFQGAIDLINAGLEFFTKKKIPGVRYVLVTAADTWCLNIKFLQGMIHEMERDGKVLAASSWGKAKFPERPHGLSTDFFIVDIEWNRKNKLFPLDYESFVKKFADYFFLEFSMPILEMCLQYSFQKLFWNSWNSNETWQERDRRFLRITDREPVHGESGERISTWPKLGLYTSPNPQEKRAALKKWKFSEGSFAKKLLNTKDLRYYKHFKNHSLIRAN